MSDEDRHEKVRQDYGTCRGKAMLSQPAICAMVSLLVLKKLSRRLNTLQLIDNPGEALCVKAGERPVLTRYSMIVVFIGNATENN